MSLDEYVRQMYERFPELLPGNEPTADEIADFKARFKLAVAAPSSATPAVLTRPATPAPVIRGSISGRRSRAYTDAARRRRARAARREWLAVASTGAALGALMALFGRWALDRGVRRG